MFFKIVSRVTQNIRLAYRDRQIRGGRFFFCYRTFG